MGIFFVQVAVLGGCVLSGGCADSGCYAVYSFQIGLKLVNILVNLERGLVVVLDVLLSVLLVVLLSVLDCLTIL